MKPENTKRIFLFSPPFSGHLNPILGIAQYLKKDFDVTIVSTRSAQNSIESSDLRGIYLLEGKDQFIHDIANPDVQVKNSPIQMYHQLSKNLDAMVSVKEEVTKLFQQESIDLVIVDFTLSVVGLLAQKNQIPWMTILPSPCVFECETGPNAYLGGVKPMMGVFGQLRDGFHRQLVRNFKRLMFWIFRDKFLKIGISSIYRKDGSETIYSPKKVFALGMKEIEFDRKCSSNFELVGPILFTPPCSCPLPLFVEFKKHILVSIGTHLWFYKEKIIKQLELTAKKFPDIVFHFSYGDRAGKIREIQENLHKYSFISYHEYLDKYLTVVHHCGTGIMYECIRHGIFSIALPIDYDQFDNSVRLEAANACVRIESIQEIDTALEYILMSKHIPNRCMELKEKFYQYNALDSILSALSTFMRR